MAKLVTGLAVFSSAACGVFCWYRHHRYPYGPGHSCIKVLGSALWNYADTHDGLFPRGEATSEASLSLLTGYGLDFEVLGGKTVPADKVQKRLAAGEYLDAETCGWHYVEGLTTKDAGGLAIVWDKVGLGYNGERLSDGGHEVLFLDGSRRIVSGKEWPEFLDHQKKLLAAHDGATEETDPPTVSTP
jgi:hypothetical protein